MDAPWSDPAFESIARVVSARTGLSFRRHRCEDLERATRSAMARAEITEIDEFAERLRSGEVSFDDFVAEVLIAETHFFRDPGQLGWISLHVLPALGELRGERHVLRTWSAGCASGEEPYSLGILLHESGLLDRATILGTDISARALEKAAGARYGSWSLRGLDAARLRQHFRPEGRLHVLADRVRSKVTFRQLNLAAPCYPSPLNDTHAMDLILCRNVLIYFDEETIHRVAERFFQALAPGGWLIMGASDPLLADLAPFEVVSGPAGIAYQKDAGAETAAGVGSRGMPLFPRATTSTPKLDELAAELLSGTPEGAPTEEDVQASDDEERGADAVVAALEVRAEWNVAGPDSAELLCLRHLERHPLSAELHYLHAALLYELSHLRRAADAARRAIYLDRFLAIAHFLLGGILGRLGEEEKAAQAYRNARQLSLQQPPGEALAMSDGISAGGLAQAAELRIATLASGTEDQTE